MIYRHPMHKSEKASPERELGNTGDRSEWALPCFMAPLRRSPPPHTNPSLPSNQMDGVSWVLAQDVPLGVDQRIDD